MNIDLKKGLPRMREEWIVSRGDVEQLPEITSEYGQMRRDDKSLDHLRFEHIALPYRAKKGEAITQMAYAKRGIITPEMEYVSIRENMNCEELGIKTHITPEFVRQEIAGQSFFEVNVHFCITERSAGIIYIYFRIRCCYLFLIKTNKLWNKK